MANGPSVDKEKFLSSIWLLISLIGIFSGVLHCRFYSFKQEFSCDRKLCSFSVTSLPLITFSSSDLLRAEIIDNFDNLTISKALRISYNAPAEFGSRFKIAKSIIFTYPTMREGEAKEGYDNVVNFKGSDARRMNSINLVKATSTTYLGLILITMGSVSAVLSGIFGRWSKHRIGYNEYDKKRY